MKFSHFMSCDPRRNVSLAMQTSPSTLAFTGLTVSGRELPTEPCSRSNHVDSPHVHRSSEVKSHNMSYDARRYMLCRPTQK